MGVAKRPLKAVAVKREPCAYCVMSVNRIYFTADQKSKCPFCSGTREISDPVRQAMAKKFSAGVPLKLSEPKQHAKWSLHTGDERQVSKPDLQEGPEGQVAIDDA